MSTAARSPFDMKSADTIIRSSDNVDFFVFRAVLILASPFFSDMFSLKQPKPSRSPGVPNVFAKDLIPIAEDSKTFDSLLRLCYPIDDPELLDLSLVENVLEAAEKYQMDEATKLSKMALRRFIPLRSLDVCAISCRLRIEEEARLAAEEWKKIMSITKMDPSRFEETLIGRSFNKMMTRISAGAYFRFLYFLRNNTGLTVRFIDGGDPSVCRSFGFGPRRALTPDSSTGRSLHNTTGADTTLISTDGVEFPVYSTILRIASAGELLTSASSSPSPSSTASQPPLVTLHIDLPSKVLAELLRLCYPFERVNMTNPLLWSVCAAAVRWNIIKVISTIRAEFRRTITPHNPNLVSLYFNAMGQNWYPEAQDVARLIARQGIQYRYAPEMESNCAMDYYKLLRLCYDFSLAARTKLSDLVPNYSFPLVEGSLSLNVDEVLALPIVANELNQPEATDTPIPVKPCTHIDPNSPGICAFNCQNVKLTPSGSAQLEDLLEKSKVWKAEVDLVLSTIELQMTILI
ncbi:hypothetical protein BDY19DRAFT_237719 [Irpex rosettiformis]|uniref:Uncharacterized protein n=1 Tax=Irpex rosettiformis TaxID=378272 RepID=A0ACB8U015_9APHY|nr:hypothetical protein BDY19DRAFT_237719 [Irpex rosettiformis]